LLVLAALLASCSAGSGASSSPENTAWVAVGASVTLPGTALTALNLTSRQVEGTVPLGSLPSAMAFTANNRELLAVTQGDDMLHEIDPTTRSVVRSVRVGVEPDAIAVAPGGTHGQGIALVANLDSDSVTPVDLGTWRAGPPIAVGIEPVAIAVASVAGGGSVALVADFGSDEVTPITLSTMQAGAPIAAGPGPQAIAIVGGEAVVANFGDRTLTPISLGTLTTGPAVALPANPTGLAVAPSGTTLYVSGGASVVPVTAGLVVGTPISLPDAAQAIALDHSGHAWVALQAGEVVPVSLPSGVVGRPIHVGGHPSAVAIAAR
jgi:DNA-binding beta-propeller fold protein YncE